MILDLKSKKKKKQNKKNINFQSKFLFNILLYTPYDRQLNSQVGSKGSLGSFLALSFIGPSHKPYSLNNLTTQGSLPPLYLCIDCSFQVSSISLDHLLFINLFFKPNSIVIPSSPAIL